jgi:hypothetical protein
VKPALANTTLLMLNSKTLDTLMSSKTTPCNYNLLLLNNQSVLPLKPIPWISNSTLPEYLMMLLAEPT